MNNPKLLRTSFIASMLIALLSVPTALQIAAAQPGGQTLYACVINNKTFIVGANNPETGLFYTSDDGKDWNHMGWTNGRPFGIALDTSTHPLTIYLAEGNGVHKSIDGGMTWAIKTGWEITEVQKITIDPKDHRILYISTPYGVWKSTDGGGTWVRKTKGLKEVRDTFITSIVIDRSNTNRLLLSSENGVFESMDAGESWHASGLQGKAVRRLVDDPKSSSHLLVGTEEDGVFVSDDGGRTWQERNNGLTDKTIYAVEIDPNNSDVFYAGGFKSGILKSSDRGTTWRNSTTGLTNLDIHSIAISPIDSKAVYVGTIGGGVFKSTDAGETWTHIGLESCLVWDMELY
jgi:photosystem II stability/assembly factor-like uncharacterized protein